ncbi:MAG: alpha/beta hydrolase [Chloroflexota bacterium]|nr:alpha/beta hydrolase [Chloroflexota bacterium]
MSDSNPQSAIRNPQSPQWVFVHGAGGNGDFWELVRAQFPGAWCPDLPGHANGRARRAGDAVPTAEAGRDSVTAYADWLMAAISAQDWPAVVLVGHSMGGAIAQTVALRRPAWLQGLVLSGTGARLRVAPELPALIEHDPAAAVDWVLDHGFATPPSAYRRAGVRRQLLRVPAAVTLGDYAACNGFDVMAEVTAGGITGPTVVLCGDADAMTPPKYSAWLAAHIAGAALGSVPDAGHLAPVEQPAAWTATVQRLRAGLTESGSGPSLAKAATAPA